MSLRVKALLSSIAALLGLIAVSYVALQLILPSSFARLEEQTSREDSARALDALSVELAQLESTAGDWARWDDTYAFIEDANAQYVASNLTDAAFENLKLNVMVFVHSPGRVVIGKGYDLEKRKEMPVLSSLYLQLTNNSFLLNHSDTQSVKTGIISLPEGPLLVSALPILTSEEQGPIRGTLLFGRWLDVT
jgi:sensor domain CHASE-containing protein